jgi:hypothetical protein
MTDTLLIPTRIISFNHESLSDSHRRCYYHLHFTDDEDEASRGNEQAPCGTCDSVALEMSLHLGMVKLKGWQLANAFLSLFYNLITINE